MAERAIYAAVAKEDRGSFEVFKFVRDTVGGVTIGLKPATPKGFISFGGGGVVYISRTGYAKILELGS
jgi:hypothetical protein